MSYLPEERLVKRTKDKKYVGYFVGYEGSDLGCAGIEEYPLEEVEEDEEDEAPGRRVKDWAGVTHEEAWRLIYGWVEEMERQGGLV